jgi:hypothetical protein
MDHERSRALPEREKYQQILNVLCGWCDLALGRRMNVMESELQVSIRSHRPEFRKVRSGVKQADDALWRVGRHHAGQLRKRTHYDHHKAKVIFA